MISWRGWGILGFIAWPLIFVFGALTELIIDDLGVAFIVGCMATAAVVYLLGVWLNSTKTSRGRTFHDRHELMGDTLQESSRFYLFLAAVGFIVEVIVQFRRDEGWQVAAIDVPVLIALAALVVLAFHLAWRRRVARYRAVAERQGWQLAMPPRRTRDWIAEFTGHSAGFPFVAKVGSEVARCDVRLPVQVPNVTVEPSPLMRDRLYLINGMRVAIGAPWYDEDALRRALEFASDLVTRDIVSRTRGHDLSGWRIGEVTLHFGWSGRISDAGLVDLVRSVTALAAALPPSVLARHALRGARSRPRRRAGRGRGNADVAATPNGPH